MNACYAWRLIAKIPFSYQTATASEVPTSSILIYIQNQKFDYSNFLNVYSAFMDARMLMDNWKYTCKLFSSDEMFEYLTMARMSCKLWFLLSRIKDNCEFRLIPFGWSSKGFKCFFFAFITCLSHVLMI